MMNVRNFRCLFENTTDGIVHSGCILDTANESRTNFVYMCGLNIDHKDGNMMKTALRAEQENQTCHIFVLASFSLYCIKKMLGMIRTGKVESILMPYITPVQRFIILQSYENGVEEDLELQDFLEHPYLFLQHAGIENIYFLYGNGSNVVEEVTFLENGHHFKGADKNDLDTIKKLEGYSIPVVKAGYIIENKWIFYFGCYGRDISSYEQFSIDFPFWKRMISAYRGNSKIRLQMKQLYHEYTKQFGTQLTSTVVMYHSPLYTSPNETDSVMTGKIFSKNQACVPYYNAQEKNCLYSCMYGEDYTIYRKHKNPTRKEACFGMLLLGNVNMNRHLQEVIIRFNGILSKVRAVALPKGGCIDYWNRQCLPLLSGDDLKYWVCGSNKEASPEVISDIVMASPRNQIVTISAEYGYCFSGYLLPAGEIE